MCDNTGPKGNTKVASVWDVQTGFLLAQLPKNNRHGALCFASEDVLVASEYKDGTVNVFSTLD
jgi:hypothetical protein